MMTRLPMLKRHRSAGRQAGMGLIELMIAMFVLAVGLIGVLGMILAAMASNNRNQSDTSATFVAQFVIEQIGAAGAASSISLTDCSGNVRTLTLTPTTTGAGASLYTTITAPDTSLVNTIDWTQLSTNVTSGYQMNWDMCDANNIKQTFDVRWNMLDMSTTLSGQTKMVTVGARPRAAQTTEIRRFALPATLRLLSTN